MATEVVIMYTLYTFPECTGVVAKVWMSEQSHLAVGLSLRN